MARSTCDQNAKVPKGMMKFEVINSTIKDKLGQYCVPGDMAVLDKKMAKGYLDKNFIKVALPEFDIPDGEDTDTSDEDGADASERAASESAAGASLTARRARAAAQRKARGTSGGTVSSEE